MGRRTYRILVGKPERKRSIRRPRRRWDDNVKMNVRETIWGDRLIWLKTKASGRLL
jgi:hypothetical protein